MRNNRQTICQGGSAEGNGPQARFRAVRQRQHSGGTRPPGWARTRPPRAGGRVPVRFGRTGGTSKDRRKISPVRSARWLRPVPPSARPQGTDAPHTPANPVQLFDSGRACRGNPAPEGATEPPAPDGRARHGAGRQARHGARALAIHAKQLTCQRVRAARVVTVPCRAVGTAVDCCNGPVDRLRQRPAQFRPKGSSSQRAGRHFEQRCSGPTAAHRL